MTRRHLIPLALIACSLLFAAPASADTYSLSVRDPAGDTLGGSARDLATVSVTHTTETGRIGITFAMYGDVADYTGAPPWGLSIVLGRRQGAGCAPSAEARVFVDGETTRSALLVNGLRVMSGMSELEGNSVRFYTSNASLIDANFDCATATTNQTATFLDGGTILLGAAWDSAVA